MYSLINNYCENLLREFNAIPQQRKNLLEQISVYINAKQKQNQPARLVYICTHNSRRSHYGQIWAKVASVFYGIQNVQTYSGGTEATAFNINAINALKRVGFLVDASNNNKNPVHFVSFGDSESPLKCFSKVFNDSENPAKEYAAIMTCSEAEKNCPFIPGVELRIGTPYDDPKTFDDTPFQDTKYDERCRQIALETMYVFSKVNSNGR